jgi:signal transduction histidine kinase
VAGGTERGFHFVPRPEAGRPVQFNREAEFPTDWVLSLCEDREGNVWAGTGGAGLAVVRHASFQTIAPPDEWQGRAVLAACASRDGSLWIGTEGAGLYRFQTNRWAHFGDSAGIQNPYVWSLAEDSRDGLWVGTWNGGLLQRRGDFFDRVYGTESIATHVTAILCSSRGGLWLGTGLGLMRYEGGSITWRNNTELQRKNDVRAAVEDKDGSVWFGTSGSGLGRLKEGQIQQYRRSDGLANDYIGCLRLEDDGTLWIGTLGGGLTRLKSGRFSVISRKQGLPNGYICHIEDDGRGSYWMSSHGGVLRVNKTELNRCADGDLGEVFFRVFGLNDGLPTLKCSDGLQPAGCRTTDGRLWFSTSRGLVTVDPSRVPVDLVPPPVVIEHLLVNDEMFPAANGVEQNLRIPSGQHRLEIAYTGLSFGAPDRLQFKYRLKGVSPEWVNVGTRRAVNYNYMPPGNYIFEVSARNSDGIWNETPAQIAFTVMPFFWQTTWFRIVAAAGVVAGAGGIVWFETRRHMRRKLEILERQRAIENERTRIAKDIHDDLGATLTRITMLSDPLRGEADATEAVPDNISQIHDTARELTRAMDEIVWAINPQHDTLDSLVTYLEKFAQDFLRAAGMRCRLDVPMEFRSVQLSAEVRHNLFLAFKEAINNAVKHSGGNEVRITLGVLPDAFALTIEDNGHGVLLGANGKAATNSSVRLVSGDGLANMRRRLERVGGQCDIQSSPGLGTKVTFTVGASGNRDFMRGTYGHRN